MNDIISTKLLNEVLNLNVYGFKIKDNIIKIDHEDGMPVMNNKNINIYELAHKCKEWAWKNNRVLQSQFSNSNEGLVGYCCISNLNNLNENNICDHYAATEPEAIFAACQWILENKESTC